MTYYYSDITRSKMVVLFYGYVTPIGIPMILCEARSPDRHLVNSLVFNAEVIDCQSSYRLPMWMNVIIISASIHSADINHDAKCADHNIATFRRPLVSQTSGRYIYTVPTSTVYSQQTPTQPSLLLSHPS